MFQGGNDQFQQGDPYSNIYHTGWRDYSHFQQGDPYSTTFNPDWREHYNFQWEGGDNIPYHYQGGPYHNAGASSRADDITQTLKNMADQMTNPKIVSSPLPSEDCNTLF